MTWERRTQPSPSVPSSVADYRTLCRHSAAARSSDSLSLSWQLASGGTLLRTQHTACKVTHTLLVLPAASYRHFMKVLSQK